MLVLLAAAGALVLMVWLMWHRHVRCVDLIEGELRRYHFTGIEASMAWGRPAFQAYTYNVRYHDTRGRRHSNRATVPIGASDADAVQWQHRLERPSAPRKKIQEISGRSTLPASGARLISVGTERPERRATP